MQELRRGSGKAIRYFEGKKQTPPPVGSTRTGIAPIASSSLSSTKKTSQLDRDDPSLVIDVEPILRAFKARVTAASTLWAQENPELIDKHRPTNSIGSWKSTVRDLFNQLPAAERAHWKAKQEELRKARASEQMEAEVHFEYVAVFSI